MKFDTNVNINKKYFKRQLTLSKLGYNMSEDVLYYKKYFTEQILNNIPKDIPEKLSPNHHIYYHKNYNLSLFIDMKLWDKINMDLELDICGTDNLLEVFLEYYYNIEINSINLM